MAAPNETQAFLSHEQKFGCGSCRAAFP